MNAAASSSVVGAVRNVAGSTVAATAAPPVSRNATVMIGGWDMEFTRDADFPWFRTPASRSTYRRACSPTRELLPQVE